jgi:hypothetical protein
MSRYRFVGHAHLSPPEALFLWADLDRVIEWMEGVTRVSDAMGRPDLPDFALPGHSTPLVTGPGSRYTLWFGRRSVRHQVLYQEEPRVAAAHRTRLEGSFRRGETLVTFEPETDGCRITLAVRADGLLPRIVARILATGSYRGSYRSQLSSFARLADREHWRSLTI